MDTGETSVRICAHLIVTEHVIKQPGNVRLVNLDTGEILVETNVLKTANRARDLTGNVKCV